MRLVVILNGTSQKVERFKAWEVGLCGRHALDIRLTTHAGHAVELAQEAARERPDGILAAGGDGTLHQVLNGLMRFRQRHPEKELPALGIVPLGTGNDFARICGITDKSVLLDRLALGGKPTDCGVIKDAEGQERYFINVASIGMGPDVVRRLERDSRWLGSDLTYLRAIVKSFFGYRPEQIALQDSDGNWSGRIRALAIANGRSFGSGLWVAPDAEPDDGILQTFIAGDVPLATFMYLLGRIKQGRRISHPRARYGKGQTVWLTGSSDILMEADGELVGNLPAEISLHRHAIRFFR